MMTARERTQKTLDNMFRARGLYQKFSQLGEDPLASDTASVLSSTTSTTVFDFDSVIKATAVYQRCMRRRNDTTSLSPTGISTIQPTTESGAENMANEGEREGREHKNPSTSNRKRSHSHRHSTREPGDTTSGVRDSKIYASDGRTTSTQNLPDFSKAGVANSKPSNTRWPQYLLHNHSEKIVAIAVSSKCVLAFESHSKITLWSLSTGQELANIYFGDVNYLSNNVLKFSSDGTSLASLRRTSERSNPIVSVWDSNTGLRLCALVIHNMVRESPIAFSPDNKLIAYSQLVCESSGTFGDTIMLVEIATGREVGSSSFLHSRPHMLSFAEEDRRLLCCTQQGAEVWDLATYHLTRVDESFFLPLHVREPHAVFQPPILVHEFMIIRESSNIITHEFIIIRTTDNEIEVFDFRLKSKRASVTLSDTIMCVACVPGSGEIAFAGLNGLAGTWDPQTGIVKKSDVFLDDDLFAISSDGRILFYGGRGGQVMWQFVNDEDYVDFDPNK